MHGRRLPLVHRGRHRLSLAFALLLLACLLVIVVFDNGGVLFPDQIFAAQLLLLLLVQAKNLDEGLLAEVLKRHHLLLLLRLLLQLQVAWVELCLGALEAEQKWLVFLSAGEVREDFFGQAREHGA